MSATFRFAALAVALSFIVGACSEQNAPTATSEVSTPPSFNFINGPSTPGNSIVFRDGVPFLWLGTDPARDLLSLNGLGVLDPTLSEFCVGGSTFDIIEFQNVSDFRSVRDVGTYQNPTQHIYEGLANWFGTLNATGPCAAVSLPRVAEGIGDGFVTTDNCLFGCAGGANAFGWRAQGTLTDPNAGGRVRYTEEQLAVFQAGTFVGFVVENIRLRPIPN